MQGVGDGRRHQPLHYIRKRLRWRRLDQRLRPGEHDRIAEALRHLAIHAPGKLSTWP